MLGAKADSYLEKDARYDIYEPEYPSEYTDNQQNTYEPEYPSYQSDYNLEYPSDNSYKSKDSSVILKKINCNKINSNNNGVYVNLGIPNNDAIAEVQAADNEGQATTANGFWNGERKNKLIMALNLCVSITTIMKIMSQSSMKQHQNQQ